MEQKEIQKIPIVVGVTGHRQIREEDKDLLREAVRKKLSDLRSQFPHSPLRMLTSLCEGGDLLCADVAEELGIPLLAALPRPLSDYERDFSEAGKINLSRHLKRAEKVFVAPPAEAIPPEGTSRNFEFREAGIYVASHCHLLLALWDGACGTKAACGTAEAVGFALSGNFQPVSGMTLHSEKSAAVIHIFTPRGSHTEKKAGTSEILGDLENVLGNLRKTDSFNRDLETFPADFTPETGEIPESGPSLLRMNLIRQEAGYLSRREAKRYRRVLLLLAVSGALLAFSFLLYDEAGVLRMILPVGVLLIAAWIFRRSALRSECHRKYIEYRVLAECLRVQTFLCYAGSGLNVTELLNWTQQEETAWVMNALLSLSPEDAPGETHDIRVLWVDTQRDYHRKAAVRVEKKLRISECIIKASLILSISLYLGALIFELTGGALTSRPLIFLPDPARFRTVLGLLLGTVSAVTLFISGYYGKLSLPRRLSDHRKMERFYEKMSAHMAAYGQTDELLRLLAGEELTENGNWCSYQRDNAPEFDF